MIEWNVAAGQRVRDAPAERAAVFAFLAFEPNGHPQAARWDTPQLRELGYGVDVWARWDSAFFVRIAAHAVILGTSALLLGVAVTQWALWQWIS